MNLPLATIALGTCSVLAAAATATPQPGTAQLNTGQPTAAPAVIGDAEWHADYDAAVKLAKEQGKDLLVDFTGSDWCGWCIRLHKEVFAHESFETAASKDYVFVALDFPNSEEAKAKVPNPKRNDELQELHGVRGFPTILLMTADGEVFGRTGYQAGGPDAYLTHMAELRTSGKAALVESGKIIEAFAKAEGDAKVVQWEKAIALLSTLDADSPFASPLAAPVRWALTHDPKNEQGMKLRAVKALIASGQADADVENAARELDPKNEAGLLEILLQGQFGGVRDGDMARAALEALDAMNKLGFQDKTIAFELNHQAANWAAGPMQDEDLAKVYAALAKAIGSDNEAAMKQLNEMLGE